MNKETLATSATALTSFGLSFLPDLNAVLQFIVLCIGLITGVIGLVNLIVQKWKKAKEDGKIDIHEATEIAQATLQGLEELSEQVSTLDKREEIKKERGNKNG